MQGPIQQPATPSRSRITWPATGRQKALWRCVRTVLLASMALLAGHGLRAVPAESASAPGAAPVPAIARAADRVALPRPLTRPVRFAPEVDYGPFVYRDGEGRIQGLSVDLLNSLATRAGLVIDTLPARPLAEQLAAARRGEVDLISSLRPTPERSAFLAFTPPYIDVPAVLVARADHAPGDLIALAGQRVAVGRGYAVEAFVRERFPAVRWITVDDDTAGLRLLLDNQVRAMVVDVASLAFVVREHGWSGIGPGRAIGFSYALSFAYRKDWPELGAALTAAIQAHPLIERERIVARWLPATTDDGRDRRLRQLTGIALAAVAIGALAWVVVHRRRVTRATGVAGAVASGGEWR